MQLSVETITVVIGFLTVVGALWAALASHMAASATRATAEASLVKVFFDEYFDQQMSDWLRTVRTWKDNHGEDFAAVWYKELRDGNAEARKVDEARRKIKGYFEKATRLYSFRLIRKKTFRAIALVAGINLYFDVIDPLELALNPKRTPSTREKLLFVCGRYEGGDSVRLVRQAT